MAADIESEMRSQALDSGKFLIILPSPTIQSVVTSVNLGCTLSLKAFALHALVAEYNPNKFAMVMIRIRNPKLPHSFSPLETWSALVLKLSKNPSW